MKELIITEKPSVARDFARACEIPPKGDGFYEGEKVVITWAIGHLLRPCYPEEYNSKLKQWREESLPILVPRLSFRPNPKTSKQLKIITSLLKRNDITSITVATDAGREGELIARSIVQYAGVKKESYRFWTSQALSNEVITQTLNEKKPLDNYNRLYHAGLARQYADWIVGINLTRMATVKFGDLYSIGRVQTAVLALIINRHHEIERFQKENYWHVQANFDGLTANWFDPNQIDSPQIIKSQEVATKIKSELLAAKNATVKSITKKEKTEAPPQLFSLTELQRVANTEFGFSAKKTLELAQELYEKDKALSYPRTDARVLGSKSFSQVSQLVEKLKSKNPGHFEYIDSKKISVKNLNVFNDKKLTDHHALIPLKASSYSGEKGKLFDLVCKRFAMVFCQDHIFAETTVRLQAGSHLLKAKGKTVMNKGWKSLDKIDKDTPLPALEESQILPIKSAKTVEKKTTPPPLYTEASLLRDMINPGRHVEDRKLKKIFRGEVGLGTQATRAQIIETLLERKYIIRDKKKMVATPKGIHLIDSIKKLGHCSQLANPEETAKWEEALELVSQGEGDVKNFVERIREFVTHSIEEWKKIPNSAPQGIAPCPFCQGQITEMAKSYSCSNWKNGCAFTVWKRTAGKRISLKEVKNLIQNGQTTLMKGFKSKKGNQFSAKLTIQGDKIVLDYDSKES